MNCLKKIAEILIPIANVVFFAAQGVDAAVTLANKAPENEQNSVQNNIMLGLIKGAAEIVNNVAMK